RYHRLARPQCPSLPPPRPLPPPPQQTASSNPINKPTSLSLQFASYGDAAPTKVSSKNVKDWHWSTYVEACKSYSCLSSIAPAGSSSITAATTAFGGTGNLYLWILVISFENEVSYRKIRLQAHGGTISDWKQEWMDGKTA